VAQLKVRRTVKADCLNNFLNNTKYDLDFAGYRDNQKRPLSEIFLTIVNKGYSGYFNEPSSGVGLKQGWGFNLTK
jgi:hypothetical protein